MIRARSTIGFDSVRLAANRSSFRRSSGPQLTAGAVLRMPTLDHVSLISATKHSHPFVSALGRSVAMRISNLLSMPPRWACRLGAQNHLIPGGGICSNQHLRINRLRRAEWRCFWARESAVVAACTLTSCHRTVMAVSRQSAQRGGTPGDW